MNEPVKRLAMRAGAMPFGATGSVGHLPGVDETAVRQAEQDLLRLLDASQIAGRTVLDVGCGPGLYALAAAQLGAARVVALDLDPRAAAAATKLLGSQRLMTRWRVLNTNLFDLEPRKTGYFDIVCCRGGLEHSGDVLQAVGHTASFAAPGGLLLLKLYRRTLLDGPWLAVKRWYRDASPDRQRQAQGCYRALLRLALVARGKSFRTFERGYRAVHGKTLARHIQDWLGGYPYQGVAPEALDVFLRRIGFVLVARQETGSRLGLLASTRNTYVYKRR